MFEVRAFFDGDGGSSQSAWMLKATEVLPTIDTLLRAYPGCTKVEVWTKERKLFTVEGTGVEIAYSSRRAS